MKKITKIIQQVINFTKKNWKKILIGLLILAMVGYWRFQKNHGQDEELNFQKAEIRNLEKTLEVSGFIDAKEKANLRFAAGGKVVYLGAKEGERVEKWQTIATIDQASLQKQLRQDLNNYLKERWDFEDVQDEYDYSVEPLDTRRELDKEQWNLENQVLNVEIRDIAIQNTVLSAPFAGVLVSSPTNSTGVNLLSTDAFELVNPDTLIFRAAVDEADIALVKKDQDGKIFLDAYPDQSISSKIDYISYKSQQSSTGTVFSIELPIEGDDLLGRYRLGMNGEVKLLIDKKENVLTVPFIATKFRDDRYYVDVKTNDGQTEEREIKIGLETEDYVEILEGLSEDDQILIPNQN